jgi:hypothetical protein
MRHANTCGMQIHFPEKLTCQFLWGKEELSILNGFWCVYA